MADATRLGWKERGIGAGVILLFLAAVELAVRMKWVNPILIPAPTIVAERTWEILAKGEFLKPLGSTLYLLTVAYFAASALAIAVGLLMGRFRRCTTCWNPWWR